MRAVPSLDQLARDPSAAVGLPAAALAALHLQCTAAISAIGVAWASAGQSGPNPAQTPADDKMLTIEEASERLRKGRQWLYRNAARLPFVRRISRKSLLVSEAGLNAYLAAKPALRHNSGYETGRSVGKGVGQTAAKPYRPDENPGGEGKDIAARAGRNGTRSLPQNAP
jgi:hypothetical protein